MSLTLTYVSNSRSYGSKKKKESSGYVLARVPIADSPRSHSTGLVAVGSDIYNVAGSIRLEPSSSVSVLDCQSHTWREAPSLRVELLSLSASVLDRKIYVAGCYIVGHSTKNSVEVFDTETQIWDPEPIPCSEVNDYKFIFSRCIWVDGNFHVAPVGQKALAYISKEDRWDTAVEPWMENNFYISRSYCTIENVAYSISHGGAVIWYDSEASMWRDLQGLVGLPKLCGASFNRLADYGGNLAVLWDDKLSYDSWAPILGYQTLIWCAEISLERHKSSEIWGKVEWFDHVLTVPGRYSFVHALACESHKGLLERVSSLLVICHLFIWNAIVLFSLCDRPPMPHNDGRKGRDKRYLGDGTRKAAHVIIHSMVL